MGDNIHICKCGFKCVEAQLGKTEGYCPKCNEGRADLIEKHGKSKYSKRV